MISDPGINVDRLDEAFLIRMLDCGGEVLDRKQLSDEGFDQLRALFKHPVVKDEAWLKSHLNLLFGNFYNRRMLELALRKTKNLTVKVKSVRDEVLILSTRFSDITDKNVEDLRGKIEHQVGELNLPAASTLNFFSTQNSSGTYPRIRRITSGELKNDDYIRFIALSRSVAKVLDRYVKRGPRGEPMLKQMCRALGFLYLDATGEIPRRSISSPGGIPIDRGPLLDLTRAFERLINEELREGLRLIAPTSMSDMCRAISDEIANEVKRNSR